MATPFFKGNYGSALSRVDTRPITEAGRATGQMYANMGAQVGGMIKEYGLNKEKRAKLIGEIEAHYEDNPEALSQIGMSGDEAKDKKDITEREKFVKGDMSMAQLEGYAGKLARGEVLRSKRLRDEANKIQIESATNLLKTQKDTQSAVIGAANNSLALIEEVENIKKNDPNFKPSPFMQDLIAKKNQLKVASASGSPASLPKPFDPIADEAARLGLGAAKRERDVFEGIGGVEGAVERLKEDRDLTKLSALGLHNARMNMGRPSSTTMSIQKTLSEAQKELERMGSLTTTLTDDNDKSLSVIDLLEVKPNREIGLKEGYNLTEMSDVDRNSVLLFLSQSGKVLDAQRQMPTELNRIFDLTEFGDEPLEVGQQIEFGEGRRGRVVSIENGKVNVTYEGTLYEKNIEDMKAKQAAEAAEKQRDADIRKNTIFGRTDNRLMGQPKF